MASSMWLPPLNSRYPTETNVYISQTVSGSDNRPLNGPMFFLKLDARVEFESNDYENSKEPPLETFYGLHVLNEIQIPVDEVSPERIASEVRNCSSLRFNGDITFWESHLDDLDYKFDGLSESAELFEKILNFLCVATEKTQNIAGAHSIEVDLNITKDVTVPRDELSSWHLWYEEKNNSDPLFEDEYQRAIGRPRTEEEEARAAVPDVEEEELLELEEIKFGDLGTRNCCCSICFEDFLPDSKLRKLGCDHVFDCDCIKKWLQHSNMCPLCRFNE